MLLICYPKCSTCAKAQKFLDSHNIQYEYRDIKTNNPTVEEIKHWHLLSGLPLNKFFNTSGMLYRSMELKDKLPTMSDEEKYVLLSTDGMLVKRPLLISDNQVLVGFKESEYEKLI